MRASVIVPNLLRSRLTVARGEVVDSATTMKISLPKTESARTHRPIMSYSSTSEYPVRQRAIRSIFDSSEDCRARSAGISRLPTNRTLSSSQLSRGGEASGLAGNPLVCAVPISVLSPKLCLRSSEVRSAVVRARGRLRRTKLQTDLAATRLARGANAGRVVEPPNKAVELTCSGGLRFAQPPAQAAHRWRWASKGCIDSIRAVACRHP